MSEEYISALHVQLEDMDQRWQKACREIRQLKAERDRHQAYEDRATKAMLAAQAERDELKAQLANQHDENCDTRDTMMPGKPCNCYVLLKSKLEDAIAGGTAAAELLVEAHEQIDELKAQLADAEKRGMERALEFFKPYQHAVSDAIAGRIRAEMEKKS